MTSITLTEVMERLKNTLGTHTDTALAKQMNTTPRRIQTWRHRNTIPYEEIIKCCKKFNVDLNHIFFGKEVAAPQSDTPDSLKFIQTPANHIDTLGLRSAQIINTLCIDREWTKHVLGVAPENLIAIRLIGNNMSPWAADGDLVLIDLSLTTIVNDAPYILLYGDMLVPKRLTKLPDGTLIAKSDSQYCDDEIYPLDSTTPQIIGRIIRRLIR